MLRAKTVDSARFCTQRRIEVFNFNEDRIKIIRKESRVWIPNPPSPLIRCLGCLLQRINRNRCTDSQTSNRVILFTLSLSLFPWTWLEKTWFDRSHHPVSTVEIIGIINRQSWTVSTRIEGARREKRARSRNFQLTSTLFNCAARELVSVAGIYTSRPVNLARAKSICQGFVGRNFESDRFDVRYAGYLNKTSWIPL